MWFRFLFTLLNAIRIQTGDTQITGQPSEMCEAGRFACEQVGNESREAIRNFEDSKKDSALRFALFHESQGFASKSNFSRMARQMPRQWKVK
jgi:hypothetical protein